MSAGQWKRLAKSAIKYASSQGSCDNGGNEYPVDYQWQLERADDLLSNVDMVNSINGLTDMGYRILSKVHAPVEALACKKCNNYAEVLEVDACGQTLQQLRCTECKAEGLLRIYVDEAIVVWNKEQDTSIHTAPVKPLPAVTVSDTVAAAADAFWEVVAEKHPEITTGDMDPMQSAQFSGSCRVAVAHWLEGNK